MASGGRNVAPTSSSRPSCHPELQRSITKRLDTFIDFRDGRIGNMAVPEVADDGFTYDRNADIIRCAWCGAVVADWRSMDCISVIQQLHNDSCPRGPPIEEPAPTEEPSPAEDQIEGRIYNAEVDLSSRSSAPVHMLRRDNERMREQRMCKRCNRSQVETLFLPCRHLVACEVCADEVVDCFVCDTKILGTVRIYMI